MQNRYRPVILTRPGAANDRLADLLEADGLTARQGGGRVADAVAVVGATVDVPGEGEFAADLPRRGAELEFLRDVDRAVRVDGDRDIEPVGSGDETVTTKGA